MKVIIDGIEYEPVKKSKAKNREPIEAWANVYSNGEYLIHRNRSAALQGISQDEECVCLVEIPKESRMINRYHLLDTLGNHLGANAISEVLKSLGFNNKDGSGE